MDLAQWRAAPTTLARSAAGGHSRAFLMAGGAVLAVGVNAPWATFFFGFPGKMTLAGFPGGARLFVLILGIGALVG
ncbi:MAG: hypothetical protein ACRDY7_14640, partial [Acidimicrobiia bacterium]